MTALMNLSGNLATDKLKRQKESCKEKKTFNHKYFVVIYISILQISRSGNLYQTETIVTVKYQGLLNGLVVTFFNCNFNLFFSKRQFKK